MYTLQELELKDPELIDRYSSYVTEYDDARQAGATPQCMLPGDIPTVNFMIDILLHICCMPVSELTVMLELQTVE